MNVIKLTWVFKVKQYPKGRIQKLKACFCEQGYLQIEGGYFFDTYAPFFSWLTVHIIMILSLILQIKVVQVDYTTAFIQAPITDKVYVKMPHGYKEP